MLKVLKVSKLFVTLGSYEDSLNYGSLDRAIVFLNEEYAVGTLEIKVVQPRP